MKAASLFLNGKYQKADLNYYLKISEKSFKVAVDGGFQFFEKTKTKPDLLLGDFDSIKRIPSKLHPEIEIIEHPVDKNKTDLELALDEIQKRGYSDIRIIQPETGELDHFLGNLFLIFGTKLLKKLEGELTIQFLNVAYEISFISDQRLGYEDCSGDLVSVFPLSNSIILNERGFQYPAVDLHIKKGSSYGLRNYISKPRASLEVAGKALIFQKYKKPGGRQK